MLNYKMENMGIFEGALEGHLLTRTFQHAKPRALGFPVWYNRERTFLTAHSTILHE